MHKKIALTGPLLNWC